MSNKQEELLEARLDKRRRFRSRRFGEKNSFDKSEIVRIQSNSTTQSLDRKSTTRINSTRAHSPELPPVDRFSSKQTSIESGRQSYPIAQSRHVTLASSTSEPVPLRHEEDPVILPAIKSPTKSDPIPNEKSILSQRSVTPIIPTAPVITSAKDSNSVSNVNQATVAPIVSPVRTSFEKSNSIPSEKPIASHESNEPNKPAIISSSEKFNPIPSEKPVASHESVIPNKPAVIPSSEKSNLLPNNEHMVSSVALEKSPSIAQQSRGYSTPNQMNNVEYHPSTSPSNAAIFPSKPITRAVSEQTLPIVKFKHQPVDSILAKQNSLALPYLFNKRLVHAQLSHVGSSDLQQSYRKTAWE